MSETIYQDQETYLTTEDSPLAGVPDDRSHIQRQLDADWRPTPVTQDGQHRFDNQIAELNRRADEQTAPREPNTERRLASFYQDMKEREFDSADTAADAAQHAESVQPQLEKIKTLREQMLADKALYVLSDFIALDKAEKLYSTPGCSKQEANQYYQQAARKAELIVDHAQQQRDLRIAGLLAEVEKLRTVPKFAVQVETAEPEADESAKRLAVKQAAIKRHFAQVGELINAGKFDEAEALSAQGWRVTNE